MLRTFRIAAWAAAVLAQGARAETPPNGSANPNAPLDHPYTLRNFRPGLLEREYHRLIATDAPQTFIWPRACVSGLDSSNLCEEAGHWRFSESGLADISKAVILSPQGGYEYRRIGENAHAAVLGLYTEGYTGPLSFALDARMYSESHDQWEHPSFDREALDRQDEKASGSVAYTSYSRYRASLSYDWAFGRLSVGRDAVHWGPGLFSNLVFHQDAVPFNQLSYTTHLGPFTVQSLYGQLLIGDDWESNTSTVARHLYAHRYEWRLTPNLLAAVSEQLILFKQSAPFAFVPVVPLFIAKYAEKERLNNGNIAVDIAYRFRGIANVYSEFLIDDLQSPGSLLNDYWGNKWGWMAGAHFISDRWGPRAGAIVEYARVEPWVYTHYVANTAQTANFNHPLGNQAGPNSQTVTARAYAREDGNRGGWYFSLTGKWSDKGGDFGSSILDAHGDDGPETKAFLADSVATSWEIEPHASWSYRNAEVYLKCGVGTMTRIRAGTQYRY